jgi:hypothetical protein
MSRVSCCLFTLVGLMASCSSGIASTINFSGNFIFDDDVQFFAYTSPTTGNVTVNTISFADGGFAPILALYDSNGVFQFLSDGVANNDCTVANQADTLGSGFCYDASLNWNSVAGVTYFVALSQYSNFPTMADIPVLTFPGNPSTWNNAATFQEYGNHFFTAGAPFGPGCGQSGFCLNEPPPGNARGTNWEVVFTGPDGLIAQPVPETSTVFLVLGGLAILCGRLLRVSKKRTV